MFDLDPRAQLALSVLALAAVLAALFVSRPDPAALLDAPVAEAGHDGGDAGGGARP